MIGPHPEYPLVTVLKICVGVGLAVLPGAILLLVKGARWRKVVPRVAVEGRVIPTQQARGGQRVVHFEYPWSDGIWRTGSGRLPKAPSPQGDGGPIVVHVNPADPTDVVLEREHPSNAVVSFAGAAVLCLGLSLMIGGAFMLVLIDLSQYVSSY